MNENNFGNVITSLMKGMETFLSTKTVVGEPTQVGDTIILPLVDVSFGIGAGAGVQDKKSSGTGGVGGKMTPSAVLVIKDGHTKLVNIKQQDTMTKILDMIPDVVDRFTAKKDTDDLLSDAEAKEAAFPKENTKNSDICDKSTE